MGQIGRVLLVTSELRCGGAERVVVHLASTLCGLGVAAEILCLQRPGSLAKEAMACGVNVIALQSLKGYDAKAIWSLAKHLRRFRPDVINVHDRTSLPYVVLANGIGGRRPVIFSAHGLLAQDERPGGGTAGPPKAVANHGRFSARRPRICCACWAGKSQIERIDNGVPHCRTERGTPSQTSPIVGIARQHVRFRSRRKREAREGI